MKKQAFTLIELMVTVGIIAILVALGVPSYMAAVRKSRDIKQQADISNIVQALVIYRSDNGTYPQQLNDLVSGNYLRAEQIKNKRTELIFQYKYTPLSGASPILCSGAAKCTSFVMCTGQMEQAKQTANSKSNTSLVPYDPPTGAGYFCLTSP